MSATRKCVECGAELLSDAPRGLCPQCLLKRGLERSLSVDPAALNKTVIDTESPQPPARILPREGQQFGGYQIVRLLGKGGMGAVYEAEHLESERRVALKVLNHSLDSPEARKRFLREGRLAASVNHVNSVYIYGTEEIDGIPVISMELAPGGTLKDRVQHHGPLPVMEAVDVILQVIAGLEAAETKGVLHRDIKPANCFVDMDGTVKVGDFGLSISTLARGETNLTVTGSFMGTPAYSSPEQLRSDELDVRSDIYSVGVTMYYLLTGRTPFAGENFVRVLATVLEQPPESPAKLRPEIPDELARVALRCLEKQPAARFKNYEELRQALLPFSSTAPTPAPLRLRFSAALFDYVVLALPAFVVVAFRVASGRDPEVQQLTALAELVSFLVPILYFAVLEGLWGASVGKAQCELRVVALNGGTAGFFRAFLRATIFTLFPALPSLLLSALNAAGVFPTQSVWASGAVQWSWYVLLLLMFSTARRRNGFAAWHDLMTHTRVIRKLPHSPRPLIQIDDEPLPTTGTTAKLGPYHVITCLTHSNGDEWVLGYDTQMLRKVWIRKLPPGAPPLAPHLRNLGRAGRLRWLNSKRSPDQNWDAYEAPSGKAVLDLLGEKQPWSAVRYWLLDLAEEIKAGLRDQSLPSVLAFDRIWITSNGRAKLLDFPAPGAAAQSAASTVAPQAASDFDSAKRFLKQFAAVVLEGRSLDSLNTQTERLPGPLPLHARTFLQNLDTFPDAEALVSNLNSLLHKVTMVSRATRLRVLIVSCVLPLVMLVVGLFMRPPNMAFGEYLEALAWAAGIFWSLFVIVPSLIGALLFGDCVLFRRLEIALVTKKGSPASRLRVFWRTLIAWSLSLPSVIFISELGRLHHEPWVSPALLTILIVLVAVAILSALHAERGVQDRIAGTWLVPR